MRFEGSVAAGTFGTFVATRFEEVLHTSFIVVACYALDLRSKTRFRVEGKGFAAPQVLNLDSLSDGHAHSLGWSVQGIAKT